MKFQYMVTMFFLCLFIWAIKVDNVVIPPMNALKQDVGYYSRYRVKHWSKEKKLNLISDQLLIYAIVDNREQLYYMEYNPYFEATLKNLPQDTPVQLRYAYRVPKFWKRSLYDLRSYGHSVISYSPGYLIGKQKEIWKFTGIMDGVFAFLVVLGLINKPRRK